MNRTHNLNLFALGCALTMLLAGCPGPTPDPNDLDPNAVDPNATDPNVVEPNDVEPNETDPNAVDPNITDPNDVQPPPDANEPPVLPFAAASLTFDADAAPVIATAKSGVYRLQNGEYQMFISSYDNHLFSVDRIRFVNGHYYIGQDSSGSPVIQLFDADGGFVAELIDPNDLRRLGGGAIEDMVVDAQGRVYFAFDRGRQSRRGSGGLVYRIDADGLNETVIVSDGEAGAPGAVGLELAANGDLYVATRTTIERFGPDGNFISTVVESGQSGCESPARLAVDVAGNLHVWDQGSGLRGDIGSSVLTFDSTGGFIEMRLSPETIGNGRLDQYAADLVVGPNDRLYVIDLYGDVFEITDDGQLAIFADYGSGGR